MHDAFSLAGWSIQFAKLRQISECFKYLIKLYLSENQQDDLDRLYRHAVDIYEKTSSWTISDSRRKDMIEIMVKHSNRISSKAGIFLVLASPTGKTASPYSTITLEFKSPKNTENTGLVAPPLTVAPNK